MKGLTCKSYDRYRPPLCRKSPPCIFSYKPHSLPSANNIPSGLTRPALFRQLSLQGTTLSGYQHLPFRHQPASNLSPPTFLYRANLSLSLAITFHQGAFGADLNLTASNLSLSFSIFFLFFVLYFFYFFFSILYLPILHPIYRIFIFSVFFCGFLHKKQHPLLDAVSFLFLRFLYKRFYAY
jgi:hypothetical protein